MKEKAKKIFIFVGFILVVIAAAFLIWYLFFNTGEDPISNIINGGSTSGGKIISGGSTSGGKNNTSGKDINIINNDSGEENSANNSSSLTPEQIAEILNDGGNVKDIENIISSGVIGNETNNIIDTTRVNEVANGGITSSNMVTNYPTSSSVVSGNDIISYNPNDGRFYRYDAVTGKNSLVSNKKFEAAETIVFSSKSDKAVIEFPDGSNIVYDFNKDKQYILPANWHDFSFQKDGEKIAFMTDSENFNDRWLAVANYDGSNIVGIEPLGNNADKVTVSYSPNEQMVAFSRTGSEQSGLNQSVLLIGLNGENFDDLKVYGRGFHPIWSPKGDKVVYDAYNESTNYNPNLWVVNVSSSSVGNNYINLGLTTWVSKCTFDSTGNFLYCGVPKNKLPDGTGIFRDSIDGYNFFDNIYKINLKTGFSQVIAIPENNVTIDNMYISSDNSILYYRDKNSGMMYSIKLK